MVVFFFFKQKTAYEMRISDWSSDVCSSDLAIGIGLGVALAADHIVMAEDAWLQTPFATLASAPDSGLSWLLPRMIGVARAKRMLMRAERIDAATARDWGLVDETADRKSTRLNSSH